MYKNLTLTPPIDIVEKLKNFLGLKTGLELSNVFNVKPNTISSWKMRDSIPYNKVIEICLKHNIDLNELFFDNYNFRNIQKEYTKIPVLYLNNQWEYYLYKTLSNNIQYAYFPKYIDFDIIIQLSIESQQQMESKLIFAFCKKIQITNIQSQNYYVIIQKDKGFQYCQVFEVDKDKQIVSVLNEQQQVSYIKFRNIIDIFYCKGTYNNIEQPSISLHDIN